MRLCCVCLYVFAVRLSSSGNGILAVVYNPLGWSREAPIRVPLDTGKTCNWKVSGEDLILMIESAGQTCLFPDSDTVLLPMAAQALRVRMWLPSWCQPPPAL